MILLKGKFGQFAENYQGFHEMDHSFKLFRRNLRSLWPNTSRRECRTILKYRIKILSAR